MLALSRKYTASPSTPHEVGDITVGCSSAQRYLKCSIDNEILIFDEPTAVLTRRKYRKRDADNEKRLTAEGRVDTFITHKLNEIMQVSPTDALSCVRTKCIGTIDIAGTDVNELSNMMVGRPVQLKVDKKDANPPTHS